MQFHQQLEVAQKLGALRGVSQGIRHIGLVHYQQGEFVRAQQAFQTALDIALRIRDRRIVGYALWNLADSFTAEHDLQQAERLYGPACAILRALNIPYALADVLYSNAYMLFLRSSPAQALQNANEALRIAEQIGAKDIQFKSNILTLVLRTATAPSTRPGTIKKLQAQLEQAHADKDQAALYYALWRLDKSQTVWRKTAAKLYRKLHSKSPKFIYRARHEELAGSHLAPPPPLPDLPILEMSEPLNLETLLARVEKMTGESKTRKQS
jgi:tetratricopeptide (TPR) repeat protein